MKISNFKFQISNGGFTIIEALVSAGLFAFSMMSIVGVYISVQRLNQRSTSIQAIGQNARFFRDDLTKLIANGSVDYGRYSGNTVPQPSTDELFLLDKDGNQVRIYRSGTVINIQKGWGGSAVTAELSDNDVWVLDFQVYITPQDDPFPVSGGSPREQPTVTIFIRLESNVGLRERLRQNFQTTVATRQYP